MIIDSRVTCHFCGEQVARYTYGAGQRAYCVHKTGMGAQCAASNMDVKEAARKAKDLPVMDGDK